MFKEGDRVVHIRRDLPAEVVRIVSLSSGRIGYACQWKVGDKVRSGFFLPNELRPSTAVAPRAAE